MSFKEKGDDGDDGELIRFDSHSLVSMSDEGDASAPLPIAASWIPEAGAGAGGGSWVALPLLLVFPRRPLPLLRGDGGGNSVIPEKGR